MDTTDRMILKAMYRNCRVSYEELSRELGITGNSIKRRIRKLIEDGVIVSFCLRLSQDMASTEPMIALVEPIRNTNVDELVDAVGKHPFVISAGLDSSGWLVVWVEFIGTDGLSEFNSYVRGLKGVNDVELNPLPSGDRGKKIEFSRSQLRVLKVLVDDPRMPISTIAQKTGMTIKKARKILGELEDSEAVIFSARVNANAGSGTRFVLRLYWDEKQISSDEIIEAIERKYADLYYTSYVSASSPRMFAIFDADHVREAEAIAKYLVQLPSVVHFRTIIPYPAKIFRGIRETKLLEIIKESGV
ncbi:MAG: winged helix-turn-helix transcriptional regulator [Candidatus Thorarchaeota archaeon]